MTQPQPKPTPQQKARHMAETFERWRDQESTIRIVREADSAQLPDGDDEDE